MATHTETHTHMLTCTQNRNKGKIEVKALVGHEELRYYFRSVQRFRFFVFSITWTHIFYSRKEFIIFYFLVDFLSCAL